MFIVNVLYCFMCFTDIVPDINSQYFMGWVVCLIVGFHLLFNITLIVCSSLNLLRLKYGRWKYQRELRKKGKILIE